MSSYDNKIITGQYWQIQKNQLIMLKTCKNKSSRYPAFPILTVPQGNQILNKGKLFFNK